jgi:hypothetical protein
VSGDSAPCDAAREVERLKRAVFGLRDDLSRQRIELDLMRRDVASAYAMLRLLVERRAEGEG